MRQDAGILLFVLALNGFVEGSPALGDLQIPALVQETLLVPFASRAGWRASRHRGPDLLGEWFVLKSEFTEGGDLQATFSRTNGA